MFSVLTTNQPTGQPPPNPSPALSPLPPPQVNFWDIRVDRLMKKGRKTAEADLFDLVWKPTHSVPLVSLQGAEGGGPCPDRIYVDGRWVPQLR